MESAWSTQHDSRGRGIRHCLVGRRHLGRGGRGGDTPCVAVLANHNHPVEMAPCAVLVSTNTL